jgi:hypothetical protein
MILKAFASARAALYELCASAGNGPAQELMLWVLGSEYSTLFFADGRRMGWREKVENKQ